MWWSEKGFESKKTIYRKNDAIVLYNTHIHMENDIAVYSIYLMQRAK